MTLVRPLTRSVSSALVLSLLGATVTQTLEQQVDEILETEALSGDAVAQYNQQDLTSLFVETDGSGGNPSVGDSVGFIADTARFEGKTFDQFVQGQTELASLTAADWTATGAGSSGASQSGANVTITGGASAGQGAYLDIPCTVGEVQRVTLTVELGTATTVDASVTTTGSSVSLPTLDGGSTYEFISGTESVTWWFVATETTHRLGVFPRVDGNTATVTAVSFKPVPGYHLIAASDAARPVLRQHASGFYYLEKDGSDDQIEADIPPATRNLLSYTEDFSNAVWVETAVGSASAPVQVGSLTSGPTGAQNAQRIQFSLAGNTATGDISLFRQSNTTTGALTFSVYLRSFDGSSSYNMQIVDPTGAAQAITVTGSWQRFEVTATATGTINYGIRLRGGVSPTNSDTADVLFAAPQLELGSTPTDYQHVAQSGIMPETTIVMAVRTSDTDAMLLNGDDVTKYAGLFRDGQTSTVLSAGVGSPSYRVDGAAWAGTTRDDLHTSVADGEFHVVTIQGANLSGWSKVILGFYAASSALNAAFDYAYGPVILPDPSAEDLATIEQAAAAACGVTLA